MKPLLTKSGLPHSRSRDWPYSIYLLVCLLHEQGFTLGEIAKESGKTSAQISAFLNSCWLSPVGGYADLKRRIEADIDFLNATRGGA